MKKLLTVILSLILTSTLLGCNKGISSENSSKNANSESINALESKLESLTESSTESVFKEFDIETVLSKEKKDFFGKVDFAKKDYYSITFHSFSSESRTLFYNDIVLDFYRENYVQDGSFALGKIGKKTGVFDNFFVKKGSLDPNKTVLDENDHLANTELIYENYEEFKALANNILSFIFNVYGEETESGYRILINNSNVTVLTRLLIDFIAGLDFDNDTTLIELVENNNLIKIIEYFFEGVSANTALTFLSDCLCVDIGNMPAPGNKSAINYIKDLLTFYSEENVCNFLDIKSKEFLVNSLLPSIESRIISILTEPNTLDFSIIFDSDYSLKEIKGIGHPREYINPFSIDRNATDQEIRDKIALNLMYSYTLTPPDCSLYTDYTVTGDPSNADQIIIQPKASVKDTYLIEMTITFNY